MNNFAPIDMYKSPIYIHSHDKNYYSLSKLSLSYSAPDGGLQTVLGNIVGKLNELMTPEVIRFYNNTHTNNGLRKNSNDIEKLLLRLEKMRAEFIKVADKQQEQHTIQRSKKYAENKIVELNNNLENSLIDTFIDKGSVYALDLLEFLIKNEKGVKHSAKELYKKGEKLSTIGKKDVKDIFSLRNGELTKSLKQAITLYKNQSNKIFDQVYGNFKEELKSFEEELNNYLATYKDLNKTFYSNPQIAKKTAESFYRHKIGKYAISGQGFTFEWLQPAILLDSMKQGEVLSDGEKLSVFNIGNVGHSSTSDIEYFVERLGTKIAEAGLSLKLPYDRELGKFSTTFSKSKTIKRLDSTTVSKLMYYLANIKASSVFLAPKKYDRVIIDEKEEKYNFPPNIASDKRGKLNTARNFIMGFLALHFVEALLGSGIFRSDVKTNPPLILSFARYDYWTIDIIKALQKLITNPEVKISDIPSLRNLNNDLQVAEKVFKNSNFTEDNLRKLFIEKKKVANIENENRYDTLRKDDKVVGLMRTIVGESDYNKLINKLLPVNSKVLFKIDIENFLKLNI